MLFGKYLNKYYLKYLALYLLGAAGLIAVDIFQLYIPEYLGELVDLFDGNREIDLNALWEIVSGVLIVAGVMFLGRVAWRLAFFGASRRTEADLRRDMFLKSERLSRRYYHENKVGAVMAWFTTDLETIEEFLGFGFMMLFDATFLSLLVAIKMVRLDWVLSLIVFVPLLLIVVWGALVEKFMADKWAQRQREFDKLYDFSQESFSGIRVVKAFLKETSQLHAFAKIAKKNKDANLSYVKYSVLFDVIISLIIGITMALLMGLGAYFVYLFITGEPANIFGHTVELSAGNLITFIGYFETMIWPMMALGQIVSMRSRAKASLKRVSDFLDAEEEIRDEKTAVVFKNPQGGIEFRDFSFIYPNSEKPALSNVTLEIKAGETVGVVGKIGSGKTTLVSSLLRLYNVERGTLFLDGQDVMDVTLKSLRDAVAFAPQDNFLFSDEVRNNIAFSNRTASQERVEKAAKFACVDGDIAEFPKGYETVSGERGVTLSGGQKQRIAIARAYLKDAPILILDDSVSAVDVKTEEEILQNIAQERKGKTTILVASRVSTVARLQKIIVMNDGKVEAFGSPAELMEQSPTYRKMVYLQALEREVEGGEHAGN